MSFIDDISEQFGFDNQEIAACLVTGNAASAHITAMRTDLAKNWHPTGYYSPDQINTIVAHLQQLANQAQQMLNNGISFTSQMPASQYPSLLRNEQSILASRMDDAARFLEGAQTVQNNGSGVVDAPDFKQWVGSVLAKVDDAVTAAAAIACQQPWWAGVYAGFKALLNVAWSVIKAVAGVVLAAGEFVASVPAAIGRYAALIKWAVILGVGGLALYAAMQFYRKHSEHSEYLPHLPEAWRLSD